MQQSELRTSTKQRILIVIIAALMLGASVAIYIGIIISGSTSSTASTSGVDEKLVAELSAAYEEKKSKLEEKSSELSNKYFEKFSSYRSKVKSFNAKSANETGKVKTEDLKIGSGDELKTDSTGYGAYYIGWCSDEKVFDSSFDSFESPTKLNDPIIVKEDSLIEGWYLGVNGMKLGGARIVTIPGELAYGESYNPCDSESEEKNVPLKFLIMPVAVSDDYATLSAETQTAYTKLLYAQYGLEYTEE